MSRTFAGFSWRQWPSTNRLPFLQFLCFVGILQSCLSPVFAQSGANYTAKRRIDTIVVDGVLDEASWATAARTTALTLWNGTEAPASLQTSARIVWDDQYLFIGFDAKDPDVYATYTGRDVPTWEQDTFEVFVTIPGTTGYVEVDGSPTGAIWDGSFTNVFQGPGGGYNLATLQVGGRVNGTVNNSTDQDIGFTGEVRIPFSDIYQGIPGGHPVHGTQLRLNLYRINWNTPVTQGGKGATGTDTYYAWSPVGTTLSFHQPSKFGTVTFSTNSVPTPLLLKTETFDADPGWDGRNNRATDPPPRQIVQNFGFSGSSTNAGGSAGEIGGFITPAGEPAFYGKVIAPASFNDPLSASGILNVPQGGGHTLIGFFNADTANEWRTPNTIALRIYGRGTYFLAYLEYGTGLWRAGGTSFGGEAAIPSGAADYPFSLNYDPDGAGGRGTVTATFGSYSTVMTLDSGHKADGAIFNRFGILNVMKSADDPGQLWLDDVTINGEPHPFNSDPGWDQRNNRRTYTSTNVRPRFDFGYSPGSNFAGGQSGGEIGGHTFRGDSRVEFNGKRMAYYGARLNETLSLEQVLHAEGKVGFHRGVSDSTTLIGFFHSDGSMRSNDSQNSATPENFVGAAIEGPSAEGFYLYPTYGVDQEGVRASGGRGTPTPPYIYPDGESRRWTLDYHPDGNGGTGSITVTLDGPSPPRSGFGPAGGQAATLNLDPGHKQLGAHFNRFGIITTHIDGSGQTVYFDDLTYTIGTQPSLTIAKTAPAEALLQWPTNYSGFLVQSGLSLDAGSLWKPFTNVVTVNGAAFGVPVSTTNAGQFFRLRKP